MLVSTKIRIFKFNQSSKTLDRRQTTLLTFLSTSFSNHFRKILFGTTISQNMLEKGNNKCIC